jgi:hypothetical protein
VSLDKHSTSQSTENVSGSDRVWVNISDKATALYIYVCLLNTNKNNRTSATKREKKKVITYVKHDGFYYNVTTKETKVNKGLSYVKIDACSFGKILTHRNKVRRTKISQLILGYLSLGRIFFWEEEEKVLKGH